MKRSIALCIAVLADLVQIGLFPLFAAGFISPFSIGLDLVVAVVMISLLGWSPFFLPCFIAEAIPGLTLVPTWTLAVLLSRRFKANPAAPAPVSSRTPSPAAAARPGEEDRIIDV